MLCREVYVSCFVLCREVYVDPELDVPFDILMTKVDVEFGAYGMFNFYHMQVSRSSITCTLRIRRTLYFLRKIFNTSQMVMPFNVKVNLEWLIAFESSRVLCQEQ